MFELNGLSVFNHFRGKGILLALARERRRGSIDEILRATATLTAVTPYDVSRRAGKGHTANDAHITARKVIKLQPVDIGIETFLEHQNQYNR